MKQPNLSSIRSVGVLRLAAFSLMGALLLSLLFPGLMLELTISAFLLIGAAAAGQSVLAAGIAVASLFFAVMRDLSIYWALAVLLFYLYLGERYLGYRTTAQFSIDFALGIIIMTIAAFFGRVSLGQGMLFFFLGVLLTASFASEKLEAQGERIDRRALRQMLPVFMAVVVLLAAFVCSVFTPEVLRLGAVGLRYMYDLFVEIFINIIVRPIAWVLQPFFNWLEGLEGTFEWETPDFLEQRPLEEMPSVSQFAQLDPNSPVLWIAALGLGVLTAIFLFKRLKDRDNLSHAVKLDDERESVLSREELLGGFKSTLSSLMRPAGRIKELFRGGSSDPAGQIRVLYIRFVQHLRRQIPFAKDTTPREYEAQVSPHVQDSAAVHEITALYEQARYGLNAEKKDVHRAQRALKEIFRKKG